MPLSPTQYTERRDALAGLLHETAIALRSVSDEAQHIQPGLIQKHIAELENIRNKVFEDQFRLVLVARFQGGKSTTFNAVAMGGRVISPMGDGAIKCSASLIAARNCEDSGHRRVTLKWRSVPQLEKLCAGVLSMGPVDLKTPSGIANARDAFQTEFERYQTSRDRYPAEKIELLPIVDLITRFVADPLREVIQQQLIDSPPTASGVAKLVRFPGGFSLRWPDQADSFTLEESLFVFLDSTVLAEDAPSLKRLGLEVTDCPGLFASGYDTSVAKAKIATADAVWYLLDGKAVGESDLKEMIDCYKLAKDALFVSVNLKADINPTRKHITTKIMPHIEAQLAQAGLTVELQPYHALLALLSQTGARLLRGDEDADTITFMRQLVDDWSLELEAPNAAAYWAALCEHLLDRLKSGVQEFRSAGGQLSPQSLAIVERESGLSHILAKLEQFVITKRAKTILITNGLDKAISAVVNGVEKPLESLEAVAIEEECTAHTEYAKADKTLTEFKRKVDDQLEFIEGNSGRLLDEQLVCEFFDVILIQAIPQIATKIADDIYKEFEIREFQIREFPFKKIEFGELLKGSVYENIKFKSDNEIFANSFNKIINDEVKFILINWTKNLTLSNSEAFNEIIKVATRINNTLKEYWQHAISESSKLETLSVPLVPSITLELVDFDCFSVEESNWIDNIANNIIFNILVFPFNLIFKSVAMAFSKLTNWLKSEEELKVINEKERKNVEDAIQEELNNLFTSERDEIIDQLLNPKNDANTSLSFIRENIVKNLLEPINQTRIAFNAQRQNADALSQVKSSDRAKIADDCRRIREKSVVPLREKLEAYRNETAWALK